MTKNEKKENEKENKKKNGCEERSLTESHALHGASSANALNATSEADGASSASAVSADDEIKSFDRFPLFGKVSKNQSVRTYIQCQNEATSALGFTEHGFAHVTVVAERTRYILETLGEDDHTIDLALSAAWLHDIGNIVNRVDHSQSGALMAFQILNEMKVPAEDTAQIICAIGNHDEGNGVPVSRISAALILADKSDVRRSRVLNRDESEFDIHDRVNYSVNRSEIKINKDHSGIKLKLHIDTRHGEIGEYFEIFMDRMLLCKKAANSLGLQFHLIINEMPLM